MGNDVGAADKDAAIDLIGVHKLASRIKDNGKGEQHSAFLIYIGMRKPREITPVYCRI